MPQCNKGYVGSEVWNPCTSVSYARNPVNAVNNLPLKTVTLTKICLLHSTLKYAGALR